MKAAMRWFVEIIQERQPQTRLEECASLREAREMAEQAEGRSDFDSSTDSIAIYRGETWLTAKLFE